MLRRKGPRAERGGAGQEEELLLMAFAVNVCEPEAKSLARPGISTSTQESLSLLLLDQQLSYSHTHTRIHTHAVIKSSDNILYIYRSCRPAVY